MPRELSVVIPTFNEKANIEILVPQLIEVFDRRQIDGEIVIVDDSSTDGTRGVLKAFERDLACVHVIYRSPPNSLARSWYEGFSRASKVNTVCMDADLCHDPRYLPPMLDLMDTCDIVIGSRYIEQGQHAMEGKSWHAIMASIIGQYLTRWATGIPARDTSHSFRMFRRQVFQSVRPHLTCEGNAFLVEFIFHAHLAGYRIGEMPIIYGKRIHGVTKLKVSKEGLRFLKLLARLFIARRRHR